MLRQSHFPSTHRSATDGTPTGAMPTAAHSSRMHPNGCAGCRGPRPAIIGERSEDPRAPRARRHEVNTTNAEDPGSGTGEGFPSRSVPCHYRPMLRDRLRFGIFPLLHATERNRRVATRRSGARQWFAAPFDEAWIGGAPFAGYEISSPRPSSSCADVAARTQRIKLGTASCALALTTTRSWWPTAVVRARHT